MTTVTAPLRDLRRAAEEAEKDAATVAQLQRDLVEAQKAKIGELETENETLKWLLADAKNNLQPFHDADDKITIAALAGVAEAQRERIGELEGERDALRLNNNEYIDLSCRRSEYIIKLQDEVEALRAVAHIAAELYVHTAIYDMTGTGPILDRLWKATNACVAAGYLREGEEVGK